MTKTKTAKASATTGFVMFALLSVGPGLALAHAGGGAGGHKGGGRHMGGMFATPVAAPLDSVAVGTWAEYQIKRGDGPGKKMRQALVGKSGGNYVLESRTDNPRGRLITQTSVTGDPTADGAVKKVVAQFGDAEPMEMPKGARFLKPDPKAFVSKETVQVAAGSFAADHYRQTGPRGGTVDYWLSKDVGPFGLVKMEMARPGGAEGKTGDAGVDGKTHPSGKPGKMTVELVARGDGATPDITKPAKPFDPQAMRGRWGRHHGEAGHDAKPEAKP